MDYNKKLVGQWLEEKSPERVAKMYLYLIQDVVRDDARKMRHDFETRFALRRERAMYRKLGLHTPIYAATPQPRPQPVHQIFSLGDSLSEMTNRLLIW